MAETLSAIIAGRIRRARLSKGWNQGDLARETGILQGTISRYESGERRGVHPENLIKIADATGVTVDFLVGRTDSPDIGPRIARARGLKSMSQQQLANATGIPVSLIRQFEGQGGMGVDPEILDRIAKATGVQVDYLLGIQ